MTNDQVPNLRCHGAVSHSGCGALPWRDGIDTCEWFGRYRSVIDAKGRLNFFMRKWFAGYLVESSRQDARLQCFVLRVACFGSENLEDWRAAAAIGS
jgi:hypothetical protein